MTQASYNNYVSNILFHYQWYANQITARIVLGDCNAEQMMLEQAIVWEYIETLTCVELVQYDVDGNEYNWNCLTIDELKEIVVYLNEKFSVNYCVDFIDSTSVYIPTGSCTCGAGTYITIIDPIRDDRIWVTDDVVSALAGNDISLQDCSGVPYLVSVTPSSFALDLSGRTWIDINVLDIPGSGWDRTTTYCLTII